MNKHPEPLFQKRNFAPPGMINFANIFITPPKTFQFDLGVAGKEILTLSALYRTCQFLPLSDRTNTWEQTNSSNKFVANLNIKGISSFFTHPVEYIIINLNLKGKVFF